MSKHEFQTEVSQLLHLIIHSLYSHQEIFLRELISNASDALDKLKYLTLTDDQFKSFPFDPKIEISFDDDNQQTLVVKDTGIGMSEEELIENLGTIARSGTKNFLQQLTGNSKNDANLIGRFGVGFYSTFMVADKVEVLTRRAGQDQACRWISDGQGSYEIQEAQKEVSGTEIIVHLSEKGREYANRWKIEQVVKKYSNHIPFPIFLHYMHTEYVSAEDRKKGKEAGKEPRTDQINSASALWKRPKSELKEAEYQEFYKSLSHDPEDPLFTSIPRPREPRSTRLFFLYPARLRLTCFRPDTRPASSYM